MLEPRDFTHDPERYWPLERVSREANILDRDRLCLVHATGYLPTQEADGSITIKPRANTGCVAFSNDLHFTLNHVVASHMLGNWDDHPYVVISPFNDAVARNGVPDSINTVDTWWDCNENQDIHLPKAILVRPGQPSLPSKLWEMKGGALVYDPLPNLGIIQTMLRHDEELQQSIFGNVLYMSTPRVSEPTQRFVHRLMNDLTLDGSLSMRYAMREAGIARDDNVILQELIATHSRDAAVRFAIRSLDCPVTLGGDWAWGGSGAATAGAQALAKKMGTQYHVHNDTDGNTLKHAVNALMAHVYEPALQLPLEKYGAHEWITPRGAIFNTQQDAHKRQLWGLVANVNGMLESEKLAEKTKRSTANFLNGKGISVLQNQNGLYQITDESEAALLGRVLHSMGLENVTAARPTKQDIVQRAGRLEPVA